MRKAVIIAVALVAASSCSILRKTFERVEIVTVHDTRDSIIIRDRIIHDTARVEIPVIKEVNVTPDDSSRLENQYAVSEARIKDGLLYHSLQTKPQIISVPVEVPVSDTTSVHSENNATTHTETVYVEKDITPWQKLRLRAFWWLLAGLAACLVWIFRKPLLSWFPKLLKTIF